MTYLGIVFALIIMAAMVYMAVNKKSNFPMRIAALIALAMMMITVIICVVIIFSDNTVPVDPSAFIVGAPVEVIEDEGSNSWVILVIIAILIGLFAVIAIHSMKEHKKMVEKATEKTIEISKKFDF